jgi:hypothetical protein
MDELCCSFDDPFFISVFFCSFFVLSRLISFHANSLQNSKLAYQKKKIYQI